MTATIVWTLRCSNDHTLHLSDAEAVLQMTDPICPTCGLLLYVAGVEAHQLAEPVNA